METGPEAGGIFHVDENEQDGLFLDFGGFCFSRALVYLYSIWECSHNGKEEEEKEK